MNPELSSTEPSEIVSLIGAVGAVVILRRLEPQIAVSVSQSIVEGGMGVVELTFDSDGAAESISQLRNQMGDDAVVGAGTVLTVEDVRAAASAGAQFIVAPNTNPDVVRAAAEVGLPIAPGAFSPSEIVSAVHSGAQMVKVFPARALGPKYFTDVLAPLRGHKLMPTGGVSTDNAGEYIRAGAFAVGVGSALMRQEHIDNADWSAISRSAQELSKVINEARTT